MSLRGSPLRLDEIAEPLAAAGIAPADRALFSMKRCLPDRAPVHRVGDVWEARHGGCSRGYEALRCGDSESPAYQYRV